MPAVHPRRDEAIALLRDGAPVAIVARTIGVPWERADHWREVAGLPRVHVRRANGQGKRRDRCASRGTAAKLARMLAGVQ